MTHKQTQLQASAYQRNADLLRMYAGPILKKATAFGHFTPEQREQIHQGFVKGYGIRVVIELVDIEDENPVVKPQQAMKMAE